MRDHRYKRRPGVPAVPLVLAGTLAVLASTVSGVAPAAMAASCQSGTGAQPPSPGTDTNTLSGVAMLSACDAWAVGSDTSGEAPLPMPLQTLTEHWDGSAWTVVPSPDPGSTADELNAVAAVSPADVWAVGAEDDGTGPRTLILRWDGGAWTQVPSPDPSDFDILTGIHVVSASDIWAVGYFNDGKVKTLILHWNGTAWKKAASPSPGPSNILTAVTATSPSDAWAVGVAGTAGDVSSLTLHWDGTAWKRVPSPNPGSQNSLNAVGASSASDAWAVGFFTNGLATQTLILHWTGTAWKKVPSPNPGGSENGNGLFGVAVNSASNAWAVGDFVDGAANLDEPLTVRWNGSRWAQVTGPAPPSGGAGLSAVAAASATSMWSVGHSFIRGDQTSQAFALQLPPSG